MGEPRATGCFTDQGGVTRCRASGKRCLSHRQAAEKAKAARRRGERVEAFHCGACSTWHYGHTGGVPPAKRPRRRGAGRAWQRAKRGL